jgi:hypothetical protein
MRNYCTKIPFISKDNAEAFISKANKNLSKKSYTTLTCAGFLGISTQPHRIENL